MKSRPLAAQQLWDYAVRALGARALSIAELRSRLSARAASAPDVDTVIARLKQAGFLDDRRFAESFAEARRDNQGLGRQRVVRDLRTRRVAPALAEKAAAAAYKDTDEVSLVESFLKRKFRNQNLPRWLAEPANLASAYRKLRYAGFSASSSIRVLKRYSGMADSLQEEEDAFAPPDQD